MASSLKNFGELSITIGEIDEDIVALKKEKEKKKREQEQIESAELLHTIYQSYITAGFTPEQAWEIVTIYLKK